MVISRFKNLGFIIIFLIIIISIIFLAESNLRNRIQLYQEQQTLETLRSVFLNVAYYSFDENIQIYAVYDSTKSKLGYAFYAEGLGIEIPHSEQGGKTAGPIVILIGLEDYNTIKDVSVISHSETWWFWNMLMEENYLAQFKGLKIEDAYFKTEGGKVDCVTGATLSSTLVLDTVRLKVLEIIKYIQ